jgi:hypothetical protein
MILIALFLLFTLAEVEERQKERLQREGLKPLGAFLLDPSGKLISNASSSKITWKAG